MGLAWRRNNATVGDYRWWSSSGCHCVWGGIGGRRMSPITLILAGLVVGLYCGAVKSLLTLFNHERLNSLFLWGSGMLNQYDWGTVSFLWPRMLIVLVIVLLMIRPLAMLALDDTVIRSLGVNLTVARIAGLGIAMLVSVEGVIGFIGLFAALLACMLGARMLGPQLALAMLVGGTAAGHQRSVHYSARPLLA